MEESIDWENDKIRKLIVILADNFPSDTIAELSYLLSKAGGDNANLLAMLLLRRITSPRVFVSKGFDYVAMLQAGKENESECKLDFEVVVGGVAYELDEVWQTYFKPRLNKFGDRLIVFLEERLFAINEMLALCGKATDKYDPFCWRAHISGRDPYYNNADGNIFRSFLLDIIESSNKEKDALSASRIESWLASRVPVFVRLGLGLTPEVRHNANVVLSCFVMLLHPPAGRRS